MLSAVMAIYRRKFLYDVYLYIRVYKMYHIYTKLCTCIYIYERLYIYVDYNINVHVNISPHFYHTKN